MIAGLILFAVVAHFVMKPSMASPDSVAPPELRALVALALLACALSLPLRRRIPKRPSDQSADLFWATAATPALLTWAILEGASLLSIVLYAFTGEPLAMGPAVIAILIFLLLNPGRFDRV